MEKQKTINIERGASIRIVEHIRTEKGAAVKNDGLGNCRYSTDITNNGMTANDIGRWRRTAPDRDR
jgi:hypothetical protein